MHRVTGLIFVDFLSRRHEVLLEAMAEVEQANQRIDDGQDDEDDRKHSKCSQRFSNWHVSIGLSWVVDTGKLVDEVRQASEIEDSDNPHARLPLTTGGPCSTEKDGNGDGDGSSSQPELDLRSAADNYKKLDGEAHEEEKIELQ